jgi:hypothetical protein
MAGTKVQGCDLATVQLTETQMQALDFTDYRIAAGS